MALRYGFFNSVNGDRKYSADDMTYPYKGIVSDGVVAHPDKSDGFQVVAGTGLQVKVKAGFGLFAGKWCENDSVVNLTLSPAHVTLARIDTVYIKVDLSESGRRVELLLNTGTPSSSPTAMVFNQTSEAKYFRLADIRVNANATTISQSNITDKRPSAECGFVTNLLQNSDISATYAQWEQQFREWLASQEEEYNQWVASLAGLEEKVNEGIDIANDMAERLDTDVRHELEQAIETANNTIATLDTETREQVNQFLADSQNSVDTCISEAEQAVLTLKTETREEFNQFLNDSEGKVDQQIETSQQEFDSWFGNVQQTLNQNTLMTGYFQKFIATEDNTAEVPINITAYTSVKDVLQVHINGMLVIPDVDYIVNNFTTITLAKPIDKDTVVMFTVFKTIDGSEAETVVQQVADLSRAVDDLKAGGSSSALDEVEARISDVEGRIVEEFSYVVDSDQKLADWANNVEGNDYTSVLIRRGTWTYYNKSINVAETKTMIIKGESGSKLILGGETGNFQNTEHFLLGVPDEVTHHCIADTVTIETKYSLQFFTDNGVFRGLSRCENCVSILPSSSHSGFVNCSNMYLCEAIRGKIGFENCKSLTNCHSGKDSTSTSPSYNAFKNCSMLTRCVGGISGYSSAEQSTFLSCYDVDACVSIAKKNSSGTAGAPYHAFNGCKGIRFCRGASKQTAYYNCTPRGGDTTSTTCENIADGGFNATVIIVAGEI